MVQSDRKNQVERRDGPLSGIQHPSGNREYEKRNTVPSVGEKNKSDIRKFFQKNLPESNIQEVRSTKAPATLEKVGLNADCKFRKGVCTTHNVVGEKRTISSRKWTTKKDGLSGWSVTKKIKWFCNASIEVAPVVLSNTSVIDSESSAAPDLKFLNNGGICEHSKGISDISGVEGKPSEASESSETGLE